MSTDLKQKTVSGLVWAATQKFGTLGISFISNIVLARMLTPDDYGCIGLLAIFIAVAEVFVNGGFAAALIQKREPSQKDYSTVFFWNIFISLVFYLLLYIAAPYIAYFYNIPLLSSVLRVQGIIVFIHALSIIQLNLLRKRLEFKKLSVIQLIAAVVSVSVAIILAYNGWKVWALVIQQLVLSALVAIMLWFTSKWRPSFCFSLESFKELFGYGAFMLLSDLLNSVYDNIQGLLIGRKYSSADMGLYTQARKLETVPAQSITYVVNQVTFPVYAKLQDNRQQLFIAVRKSLRSMNFLNFPLMIFLIVVAEPLFVILFSEKWIDAVPYFRILCLSGLVNCSQSVNYQVVCAVGGSRTIFKWNILKRIIGFCFIFIGMYWGVKGILFGMVCNIYFSYIVNALVATPTTGYTILQQLKDAFPILGISLASAAICYPITMIEGLNYVEILLLQFVVFVISYLGISKLLKRVELEEYVRIIKSNLKKI